MNQLTKLCQVSQTARLRPGVIDHSACAGLSRVNRVVGISIKRYLGELPRAVASAVYQGMDMQVGYLFRRRGRMLMRSARSSEYTRWLSMSGIARAAAGQ